MAVEVKVCDTVLWSSDGKIKIIIKESRSPTAVQDVCKEAKLLVT